MGIPITFRSILSHSFFVVWNAKIKRGKHTQRGTHMAGTDFTLQHAATHGNTLQHTATHCSTMQHTEEQCKTMQHTATHCSTLQHTAAHCNTLQHTATHCNTMLHTRCDVDARISRHSPHFLHTNSYTHLLIFLKKCPAYKHWSV